VAYSLDDSGKTVLPAAWTLFQRPCAERLAEAFIAVNNSNLQNDRACHPD